MRTHDDNLEEGVDDLELRSGVEGNGHAKEPSRPPLDLREALGVRRTVREEDEEEDRDEAGEHTDDLARHLANVGADFTLALIGGEGVVALHALRGSGREAVQRRCE